jgi:hypothetical protein
MGRVFIYLFGGILGLEQNPVEWNAIDRNQY